MLVIVLAIIACIIGGLAFLLTKKLRVRWLGAAVISWISIHETRLPRFAKEIKAQIDPYELQKWAVSTLDTSKGGYHELPAEKLPKAIQTLRSEGYPLEIAYYTPTLSDGESYISIVWGGGFGHWGIDIGKPSFQEPRGSDAVLSSMWIPGIYFWTGKH
jgi:hypothetical protein